MGVGGCWLDGLADVPMQPSVPQPSLYRHFLHGATTLLATGCCNVTRGSPESSLTCRGLLLLGQWRLYASYVATLCPILLAITAKAPVLACDGSIQLINECLSVLAGTGLPTTFW